MTRQRLLFLFVALLLCGAPHKAHGQVDVSVGVRGGYEVEKGDPLVGVIALLKVGLPVKIGVSLDYLPLEREGMGFTDPSGRIDYFIFGSQLRLDLFPDFLPASLYVQGGPSVFQNASCDVGDCTAFGVDVGLGMEMSFGRFQPFLQAEMMRGTAAFYVVGGGLRIAL